MLKLLQIQGTRLGNHIFQNVGLALLAKKNNYKVYEYFSTEECKVLNFNFYSGTKVNETYAYYNDEHLMPLLQYTNELDHGILYEGYFQNLDFIKTYKQDIKSLFNLDKHENNDLFIHIRLDDAEHFNPGIDYYRECISKIKYDKIFISSDSPTSNFVQTLVKEYNMSIYEDTPINTINFGRKSNNIIMSNGTFSWWIAFLSNAKNIFYPSKNWTGFHPFIYLPEWNGV